jgi:hypothetical protein
MTEKKKQQVQTEQIHLLDVKIVKGQLSVEEETTSEEDLEFTYQTDYGLEVYTSLESLVVRLLFTVKVKGLNGNDAQIGSAEYTIEFIYKVDELKEFISMQGEIVMLNSHLAATLVMIAYSTVRGIVLTRLQGTCLEEFIMPVANPVTLLRSLAETANSQEQSN